MNYGISLKLISNYSISFMAGAVDYYFKYIDIKYRITIFYYSRINKKVKNLNNLINSILIKLLINKSIKLWDLYLDTIIFIVRVC